MTKDFSVIFCLLQDDLNELAKIKVTDKGFHREFDATQALASNPTVDKFLKETRSMKGHYSKNKKGKPSYNKQELQPDYERSEG